VAIIRTDFEIETVALDERLPTADKITKQVSPLPVFGKMHGNVSRLIEEVENDNTILQFAMVIGTRAPVDSHLSVSIHSDPHQN
jgi:hypothetical protein